MNGLIPSRTWRWIAGLLLRAFPPSFRMEYGEDWMEAAVQGLREAQEDGRSLAVARSLGSLAADTARALPSVWRSCVTHPKPSTNLGASPMESLFQDIRFGTRTLLKRPLFSLMTVGTLGLGIGAATAIFSVVEGVLLRPPPFEDPGELVSVWQTYPEWREEPMLAHMWDWGYLSYTGFERWREGQTHFQDVAIHGSRIRNVSGQGDPARLQVGTASSSLFRVLGVQPSVGRAFLPEEDVQGGPKVAVLSHSFWEERFGRDEGVLGRTLTLNRDPFTIVGVLPQDFSLRGLGFMGGPGEKPIWIPVGADGYPRRDGAHGYEAIARLLPGVTLEQAVPEARNLLAATDEEAEHSVRMVPWEELETEGVRSPLLLLLGSALVLLLIACGNVAALLLGEFTGRRHEIATRGALGAGAGRLVRQLLTESTLLGVGGALVGIGVATAGTRALLSVAPALPRLDQVGVNPTVLLFCIGLGLTTGLLFGLAPAWDLTRGRFAQALGRGWRSGSRRGAGFQRAVIGGELALTAILLVSGTLLARSLGELMAVDTGFQGDGIAMVRVFFPSYRYGDPEDRAGQADRMRQNLAALPGVVSASGTNSLPFFNAPGALSYGIEGVEIPEELSPHTSLRSVLPGYFETMGIRILEGRPILETDRSGERPVAVISETMARRHWQDGSPLGARILFGDTLEVVGVAADVVHEALDAEPLATMYVPFFREAGTSLNLVVRTAGEPDGMFPAFRQAVWDIDDQTPISRVATLPDLIRESTRAERFRTVLLLVFAGCAVLLAGAGVFGVTARGVSQRAKEMSIRSAMGAQSGGLVFLALSGTLKVGLLGVGAGLFTAFWCTRVLGQFLFGIGSWDLLTYSLSGGALLLLSLFASYLPARRAGTVPPMEVLKEE